MPMQSPGSGARVEKKRVRPWVGGALIGGVASCAGIGYVVADAHIDKHMVENGDELALGFLALFLVVVTPLICWWLARALRLPSAGPIAFLGLPVAAFACLPIARLVSPGVVPTSVLLLIVVPAAYAVTALLLTSGARMRHWLGLAAALTAMALLSPALSSWQRGYLREHRLRTLPHEMPEVTGFQATWVGVEEGYLLVRLEYEGTTPVTLKDGTTKEIYPLKVYVRPVSHPFDPARDCAEPDSRWKPHDRCVSVGPGRWIGSDGEVLVIRSEQALFFIRGLYWERDELAAIDFHSRPMSEQEIAGALADDCDDCAQRY